MTVVSSEVIEVIPLSGAEDAVSMCGGIPTLLRIAGVDLTKALPVVSHTQDLHVDDTHGHDDTVLWHTEESRQCGAVRFPLSFYPQLRGALQPSTAAVTALLPMQRSGIGCIGFDLMPLGYGIPPNTLKAFM